MSKAMDALERCRPDGHACAISDTDYATLRDYITTTEAERAPSGKSALALSTDIGIKYLEYAKQIVDVDPRELVARLIDSDRSAQRQLGRDELAARIKELEEALGVARNLLTDVRDAIKKLPATDGRVIGLGQFIPLINAQVEKTIGGRG